MPIVLSPDSLRDARDASGLTRQAVAQELGCSIAAIQSWERGWKEPAASVVPNLAALYGVPMESLFAHAPDADTPATAGEESPTDHEPGAASDSSGARLAHQGG